MSVRSVFVKIHLYLSLFLGAIFLVVGITGSVIVFDDALDEMINPELFTVSDYGDGHRKSMSEILASAKMAYPDKPAALIYPPKEKESVFLVLFKTPKEHCEAGMPKCCGGFDWFQVMVNPYTAEVLGKRDRSTYGVDRAHLIKTIYELHSSLLLGGTGRTIVGLSGIAWLIVVLSGIYLWWPRNGKFKRALKLKHDGNLVRFNLDLHRVSGIYTAIILVVVTFTGVYLIFPEYIKPVVKVFSPLEKTPKDLTSKLTLQEAKVITIEDAVEIANRTFPNAVLSHISLPIDVEDMYKVYKRQDGEVRKTKGQTAIWIDQYSGKVLYVKDPLKVSSGQSFINWQFPLHNGEALGMTGRLMIFASGIVTVILMITGTILWLKKKRRKALKSTIQGKENGK